MRGTFFAYLGLFLLGLILAYCVWLVLHAFWTMFADARTNRELDKLADEYSTRRRQRRIEDADRLNNGCQHEFNNALGALPDDVCSRCGLAKVRPAGECDHVWRVSPGIMPQSQCEHCGEVHSKTSVTE